uniref:Uncharacterized protein n=1 Tax=Oryza rufipogon TaxID=4529 RepID=A0A0E0MR38_ORYRU
MGNCGSGEPVTVGNCGSGSAGRGGCYCCTYTSSPGMLGRSLSRSKKGARFISRGDSGVIASR